MSRSVAALGAVILVGVLLWLMLAWRAPKDEVPVAFQEEESAVPGWVAPPPSAAAQPDPPQQPAAPEPEYEPEPEPEPEPAVVAAPEATEPERRRPDGTLMPPEQIKGDQGPVAEYRALYETERRDHVAGEVESLIRTSFEASKDTPDLIKSISCRETICKLEMRWSMDRMRGYVMGLARSRKSFNYPLAVSPVSPADGRGIRLVEVYLKRKSQAELEADKKIRHLHDH